MDAGAAMLQMARLVILARHEASVLMAGLASSSLPSPTEETLQLTGDPQDWPVRRQGRMRRLIAKLVYTLGSATSLSERALL